MRQLSIRRLFSSFRLLPRPQSITLAALILLLPFPSYLHPTDAQGVQDDETVRVESELVVLNVTVTDQEGKYIHKIPRRDFKVFEDGVEQKINTFAVEENPFAAAILLDASGSMETRLTLARAAAIQFLDGLRPNDVAAVYSFSHQVERLQDYTGGRDLTPLAYDVRARGITKLNDAVLIAAQDLSQRPETRRAILILSDGMDTGSKSSLDKALNAALSANITIYTVNMNDPGLPSTQRQTLAAALKKFSEKSGGRYISSPGGRDLSDALHEVLEELSNQYTVGYRPSNRTRDGKWRAIQVKLANEEWKIRTKAGYRAKKS